MTERTRALIQLAPALFVLAVLFFGSLVIGLMRSFNYMPVIGLTQPNLDAYHTVLSSPDFYVSLLHTLYVSITATAISTLLAIAAALLIRHMGFAKTFASFFFQLNLAVPHLVGAVGILYLFSQSGTFARLAYQSGAISVPADFPALVYDPYSVGVILEYIWKEVPFISLILLSNMQSLTEDYENVARSLGATSVQATRHVLLPMLLPGLLPATLIVFAFTFGAFEVPLMLGASYPKVLPLLAYSIYTDVDLALRPVAMATTTLLAAVSLIVMVFYSHMARRLFGT
jgi:putative spermidine/putrescine transport system permease protein